MLLKKMHYKCETAHPSLQTRGRWGMKNMMDFINHFLYGKFLLTAEPADIVFL